jgi:hypothetical protein
MNETGTLSFVEALHDRVEDILDACTRCGNALRRVQWLSPPGSIWALVLLMLL